MLGATFDFILSVYACLVSIGEVDSAVNVNKTCVSHNDSANAKANANANANTNSYANAYANAYTSAYAITDPDVEFNSKGVCGCCRKELHSNYYTTFAYDAREFCSIVCRKKVSDEDLLALNSYMNLYIHPIEHAI